MGHTITIDIPENVYEPLTKMASYAGRTPEDLALEWIANASQLTVIDPVEDFIGSINSGVSDWVDQHDLYLSQSKNQ